LQAIPTDKLEIVLSSIGIYQQVIRANHDYDLMYHLLDSSTLLEMWTGLEVPYREKGI
jgi:hypothetical protein